MSKKNSERGNPLLKFLDRYLGIPLVFTLGLFRRRNRSWPKNPKRIGLLHLVAIGDTILLSGPIQDLRQAFPEAEIVLFTGQDNREIAGMLEGVDRVLTLFPGNWLKTYKILDSCGRFDWWIDFDPWPRISVIFTAMARAGFKIGFNSPGQARHFPFDRAPWHSPMVHELENYRNILRCLDISATCPPFIPLPKNFLPPRISSSGPRGDYVVFHMFPGGYKPYLKEWPLAGWLAVGRYLAGLGLCLVMTGSKGDRDRAERYARELTGLEVINLAGKLNLSEAAGLLAGARLVVSVNTGIMHLAAAVRAPLAAIHGPTSIVRWGPVGPRELVADITPLDMPCAPCLNYGFEYKCNENRCLKTITPDRVIAAAERLLGLKRESP